MVENIRLYGKDLGVLIGPKNDSNFSQILIYEPINNFTPNKDMPINEVVKCLPPMDSDRHIDILHSFLNKIEIDGGIPIWRNSDCFGMKSFSEDSYDGVYFGRGELMLYFRKNFSEAYEMADYFVRKNIGLRFV